MPHHFLLYADWSANGIQPRGVRVPERVSAEMSGSSRVRSPVQFAPHSGLGIRQSAELERTSENPILSRWELRCLFPEFQHVQQFACDGEGPA